VHLNNAGAALPPTRVLDAQIGWLRDEAVTGGYELLEQHAAARHRTYQVVADLIGAGPDEVALVENATFAWHQAFWSLPLRPGDRILTCSVEYASSYISFLQAQQRRGVTVELIPDDERGQVSVEALASLLDAPPSAPPVGLVAIAHIPTNGGLVNPAEEIGRLTRAAGVPFLLDACQSVGQLPVDVDAIGCDLLSATGRKWLRGPRGTGFLYVRRALLEQGIEPAFLDLDGATWVAQDRFEMRPDARRFENYESSFAGQIGLGEAVSYAQEWGIDAIAARVGHLADGLRSRLDGLPGVRTYDRGERRSGLVTFTKDGIDAGAAKRQLVAGGFNVSVSEPSATLLDATQRHLPSLVRASPHYYNDDAELDRFTDAVAQL
jgi:cysteine desulfurase/selenocysteine lyase